MLQVEWQHLKDNTQHCLTTDNAKALAINIGRLEKHIEVLEVYIKTIGTPPTN